MASWGFVVAAANTGQAGSGGVGILDCLDCLDYLERSRQRGFGRYFDVLDLAHVGVSGTPQ